MLHWMLHSFYSWLWFMDGNTMGRFFVVPFFRSFGIFARTTFTSDIHFRSRPSIWSFGFILTNGRHSLNREVIDFPNNFPNLSNTRMSSFLILKLTCFFIRRSNLHNIGNTARRPCPRFLCAISHLLGRAGERTKSWLLTGKNSVFWPHWNM